MTHPLEQQRLDDETTGEFRTRTGWRGEERRDGGWTMWREIVGTVIGVFAVAVPFASALVIWGAHVEAKFSQHDAELIYLHKENDVQDLHSLQGLNRLEGGMVRIEQKVDRLVERTK